MYDEPVRQDRPNTLILGNILSSINFEEEPITNGRIAEVPSDQSQISFIRLQKFPTSGSPAEIINSAEILNEMTLKFSTEGDHIGIFTNLGLEPNYTIHDYDNGGVYYKIPLSGHSFSSVIEWDGTATVQKYDVEMTRTTGELILNFDFTSAGVSYDASNTPAVVRVSFTANYQSAFPIGLKSDEDETLLKSFSRDVSVTPDMLINDGSITLILPPTQVLSGTNHSLDIEYYADAAKTNLLASNKYSISSKLVKSNVRTNVTLHPYWPATSSTLTLTWTEDEFTNEAVDLTN
jgi:hypothetical protein